MYDYTIAVHNSWFLRKYSTRWFIAFYSISFYFLFFISIAYSQVKSDISEVNLRSNPIEFIVAANSNWQAENEIYFNSKVLTPDHADYKLGLYEAFRACGNEYCFRFSLKQEKVESYRWYPSAIGIDADIARILFVALTNIGFAKNVSLSIIYLFNSTLSLICIILIYSSLISRTKSRIYRIFQISLLFTPWVLFSSMSVNFSVWLRFAPIFVYLFFFYRGATNHSSNKFARESALSFSFFVSALHGFEFVPFLLSFVFLLPGVNKDNFRAWIFYWLKPFSIGIGANVLFWILVNYINTKSFSVAIMIVIHTFFKNIQVFKIEAPNFAIDSGYQTVSVFEGLIHFYFQTSSILPHPFPSQVLDLFGGHQIIVTLLYLCSSFAMLIPLMLLSWPKLGSFDQKSLLISIILNFSTVCALHGYLYNHKHIIGSLVTMYTLIMIIFLSSRSIFEGGKNVE